MKGWFTRTWSRFRDLPLWAQIPLGLLAAFVALGIISAPFAEDPDEVASTNTTTSSTSSTSTSTSTTTTLPPLPPGDDVVVARIVDGDTFEVVGASASVRLIGIDTPENTTSRECYGPEATNRLGQLLPAGERIRLVYDVQRQDRFRRTLAYVYRLSDGMFVNLAMAKEGYAAQLTVPPNVAHAEEFRAAVAEARTANRGLWSACPTATTAAPTTRAPVTSPPATAPPATRAPTGGGGAYYANCTEARAAGVTPLRQGDPGYRAGLDRDSDGIACE